MATLKTNNTSLSPSVDKKPSTQSEYAVLHEKFLYEFAAFQKKQTSLKKKLQEYLERKGWDKQRLAEEAGLEQNVIYRIFKEEKPSAKEPTIKKSERPTKAPTIETIISISLALQLSPKDRDELVRLAGRSWDDSDLHFAYLTILDNANLFLERGTYMTASDFNRAFNSLPIDGLPIDPLPDRYRH